MVAPWNRRWVLPGLRRRNTGAPGWGAARVFQRRLAGVGAGGICIARRKPKSGRKRGKFEICPIPPRRSRLEFRREDEADVRIL